MFDDLEENTFLKIKFSDDLNLKKKDIAEGISW